MRIRSRYMNDLGGRLAGRTHRLDAKILILADVSRLAPKRRDFKRRPFEIRVQAHSLCCGRTIASPLPIPLAAVMHREAPCSW